MRWLGLLLLPLAACTTTIVAPPRPQDPVTVYLVDYGRHAGLLLPRRNGSLVEYAYGDWEWFAQNRRGSGPGFAALFWSTQGALGRAEGRRAAGTPILVARRACEALLQELDAAFQAGPERVYSEHQQLEFVRSAQGYNLCHNCNHVLAGWLEKLGCDVSGSRLVSSWTIKGARTARRRTGPARQTP